MTTDTDTTAGTQAYAELLPGANVYRVRCVECKAARSKKGNDMLTQTFEVFAHAKDELNGLTIDHWATLSSKSLDMFNAQREALGLPKVSSWSQVDVLDYKGADGFVTAQTTAEEQKNEVTGETLINPNTGKPVMAHRRRIVSFLPRK